MNTQSGKPSLLILILLISYAAVSAVLFTPALPQTMMSLHTTNEMMQLTIAIFLFGYAAGQLLYGPLAQAYGRKKALYVGFVTALVGEVLSIFACFAGNVILLLVGRFITAIGACAGYAITFAMVRDAYELTEARKVLAIIILAFAVAPGIAVALGGYIADHFNYVGCFYFLLGYGCLLLFLVSLLPETAKHLDKSSLQAKRLLADYIATLRNRVFLFYGICFGILGAFLYIYYADAPFIAQQDLHLSTEGYGFISMLTSVGYFIGNVVARWLANKWTARQVIHLGLATIAVGLVLLGLDCMSYFHWSLLFFLAVAVCFTGGAMMVSNFIAIGMHSVSNVASSSAMFGFINILGPMLSVVVTGYYGSTHLFAFFLTYASLFFLLFVCSFRAERLAATA